MVHLYKIAKEERQVKSPAAVGRVMSVSQQRLKNWENRGVSKEGALIAQQIFGVDSNFLLALNTIAETTNIAPMVYETSAKAPLPNANLAQETIVHHANHWPFNSVTASQWRSLTASQKKVVEGVAKAFISAARPQTIALQPRPQSATLYYFHQYKNSRAKSLDIIEEIEN